MRTLVVAPHADDEVLGCAGTLLRRRDEGATVGWVLVSNPTKEVGWSPQRIDKRVVEIENVRKGMGIEKKHLYQLNLPAAQLDLVPMALLVSKMSEIFKDFQPEEVLLPHPGDAHGDHHVVFDAASACTKWFRCPSLYRVLAYETISETDAGLEPFKRFTPTVFVDISPYLDRKIQLMSVYESEVDSFPFPRSAEAIRALAALRGVSSGFRAAEAFEMLRERLSFKNKETDATKKK